MTLTSVFASSVASKAPASTLEEAAGPKLGLQTWTCRNMTFEQVVDFAVKHQLKYLEFMSGHFDPLGTREETLRKMAILDKNGLVMYSFGVNQTSLDIYSDLLQLPLIGSRDVYRLGWPALGILSRPASEISRGLRHGLTLAPKLRVISKLGPQVGPRLAALRAAVQLERQAA